MREATSHPKEYCHHQESSKTIQAHPHLKRHQDNSNRKREKERARLEKSSTRSILKSFQSRTKSNKKVLVRIRVSISKRYSSMIYIVAHLAQEVGGTARMFPIGPILT